MDSETGAEALVHTLERLGVDTVFGIPGIHNLDVYDRLIDSRIRHVTSRNEAGAAFMADGYARGQQRPGVALVISGPGLTNALTALGEARHDSVPVVLISSDIPRRYSGTSAGYLHQLAVPTTVSRAVTKESIRVTEPDRIEEALRYLYGVARSGRPGPVHLEIPIDVLQERTSVDNSPQVDRAAQLLSDAVSPFIVVGGGAAGHGPVVTRLAEALNAPVVTSAAGKGVLPEDHPLSLGGRLHVPSVRGELERADTVLVLGSQLSSTDLWVDRINFSGRVVAVNLDAAHMYATVEPEIALRGDIGTVVPGIIDRITTSDPDSNRAAAVASRVQEIKKRCSSELPNTLGLPAGTISRMQQVLAALSETLGAHGVLTADMTTIAYCAISEYLTETPGSFLHPAGFGTLGFALPAAIGVALRADGRPVAALVGDGGFQFTMQEFAVAVQEALPIPVIVWDDGGYGEIRREEEQRHPGRRIAVDNIGPDFCAFAESYGAAAERIENTALLKERILAALDRSGPTLLEVRAL
ncbi:MAG: thiamine pyrophosphate-binding protein [Alkalispirochaeta sp.]